MISLIDTHAHIDFKAFDDTRNALLQRLTQTFIKKIIIPGTQRSQWSVAQKLSREYSQLYFAVGIHPWFIENAPLNFINDIETYLSNTRCVAIGECGLDKTLQTPISAQQKIFEQHLALANKHSLPLIIHSVKTHNEIIKQLKDRNLGCGGVIHGFSGSYETAKTYWDMGFYLGVGGTITYPRAQKTREAVRKMPLESLLLETDAPDMPLCGKQGQPNSPLYLPEVAECLGELRGETLELIAATTTENALKLFKKIRA